MRRGGDALSWPSERLGWETGVVHVGVELRRSGYVRYDIGEYERPEEVILFNAGYACYLIKSERPEKGTFLRSSRRALLFDVY